MQLAALIAPGVRFNGALLEGYRLPLFPDIRVAPVGGMPLPAGRRLSAPAVNFEGASAGMVVFQRGTFRVP